MNETLYCDRCRKTMKSQNFYKTHLTEKYPTGFLPRCKECTCAHVDNYDPKTYLWILQECDVPYIPSQWDQLLANYGRDPSKLKTTSIVGRYLGKMYIKQYKDLRWADTETYQELENKRIREAMEAAGRDAAEINEQILLAKERIKSGMDEEGNAVKAQKSDYEDYVRPAAEPPEQLQGPSYVPPAEQAQLNEIEETVVSELTDEDRRYLFLKWGRYTPQQWIKMETFYTQMVDSLGIEDPGDINTLILACKASLKANELLDMADVEGAQKMTKTYENLMKVGNWTAAQKKEQHSDNIDCIGTLALACEKEGFIPRFYTSQPKDKPDKIILDMQKYTRDLILQESGLSQLFENAMRQREEEAESIAAARELAEKGGLDEDDLLFDYDQKVLTDEDIADFNEFLDEEAEKDSAYLDAIRQEDDL